MTEDIHLRLALDDLGRPYLCDQHGRALAGVRDLAVTADLNDVVKVSATILCHHEGKPVCGAGGDRQSEPVRIRPQRMALRF